MGRWRGEGRAWRERRWGEGGCGGRGGGGIREREKGGVIFQLLKKKKKKKKLHSNLQNK